MLDCNLFGGFKRDFFLPTAGPGVCERCAGSTLPLAGRIVRHARALILNLAVDAESLAFLSHIRGQCQTLFGIT